MKIRSVWDAKLIYIVAKYKICKYEFFIYKAVAQCQMQKRDSYQKARNLPEASQIQLKQKKSLLKSENAIGLEFH